MKKKRQNGKRRANSGSTTEPETEPEKKTERAETTEPKKTTELEESGQPQERGEKRVSAASDTSDLEESTELEFDDAMVEHLRVTTSLIEEREVSREEILEMLNRVMRQHSFASERRLDYVVRFLKENPP